MVELRDLLFRYGGTGFGLHIPALTIGAGEAVAVIGPSGSGKTTLLNLIAGILVPARGEVLVDGESVGAMSDSQRRHFRLRAIGQVFQTFELLEYLNVLDNILLPARIGSALTLDTALRERAAELARDMSIGDKLGRPISRLSQGEKQRVAVCRALLAGPRLILADEPTGNLDPVAKQQVLQVLLRAAEANRASLVMVTHDISLLRYFDRHIDLGDMQCEDESC